MAILMTALCCGCGSEAGIQKMTYGRINSDVARSIQQTSDGLVGNSERYKCYIGKYCDYLKGTS
jgi:hypothetical protein